jgi:hypothetical protein
LIHQTINNSILLPFDSLTFYSGIGSHFDSPLVTTGHSSCIIVKIAPYLKYVDKMGKYQAFEGDHPLLFRSPAYPASIIYYFGSPTYFPVTHISAAII